MAEPSVQIQDLRYRYRGEKTPALKGVDLTIARGEFLVLMGASEAGKSTLVASLNGLIPHYHRGRMKGNVQVLGRNTRDFSVAQMAEVVGLVFQDFEAQLFSTNVELEVAFGPENFAVPREEIARRIDESLAYVGLEAFRHRAPSTLSGGQKQKLAIASVLAMRPQVLAMDEPTTDLDPISKYGIFQITDQLRKRDDITLIVVEHETEEVLHADRIALFDDGELVKVSAAREILQDVDLLESHSVMPLGIPRFFKKMGLEQNELPITIEEGIQTFRERHWRLSDSNYQALVERETAALAQRDEPLIQCRGLTHTYPNGVQALRGIDLDIMKGDMVAIVGQNGSGKTTLAKHFNALLTPTDGEVLVHGEPTEKQGVFKIGQTVGYVFQNPDHQIFSETVFDEVSFSLRIRKMPENEIKARVEEALVAVGLEGMEDADPFSMTKSGRQRVAVASVLAARPEVLILDEPTTGLDYSEQRGLMDMVRKLNEEGSTIIFVTHHMWVVAEYARRVYVIKDGRIFLEGATREVFAQEEALKEAFLRPPHFVQFSNRLGKTLLTPEEMLSCMA